MNSSSYIRLSAIAIISIIVFMAGWSLFVKTPADKIAESDSPAAEVALTNPATHNPPRISPPEIRVPPTIPANRPAEEYSDSRMPPNLLKKAAVVFADEPEIPANLVAQVARAGVSGAANEILKMESGKERRAAIGALTQEWSRESPEVAARWLAEVGNSSPQPALWDAAVGGFIEGIAIDDPESAAIAADLLDGVTRTPTVGDLNRSFAPDPEEIVPRDSFESESGAATEPEVTAVSSNNLFLIDPDDPDPLGLLLTPEERRRRFPGDPGFPGDPDFLRMR